MTTLLRPLVYALLAALLVGTSAVDAATASGDRAFCHADEAMSSATAGVGVHTVEDASATGAPHSHLYGYDDASTSGAATTVSGVGMEVLTRTGDSGYVYDAPDYLYASNGADRSEEHTSELQSH